MRITPVAALALVAFQGANGTALSAQAEVEIAVAAEAQGVSANGMTPNEFRAWRLEAISRASEIVAFILGFEDPDDFSSNDAGNLISAVELAHDHVDEALPF